MGDNHLKDSVELVLAILERYRKENRSLTDEEKKLVGHAAALAGVPFPSTGRSSIGDGDPFPLQLQDSTNNITPTTPIRPFPKRSQTTPSNGDLSPTKNALQSIDLNTSSAALDLESLTQFAVACNKVTKNRFELAEVIADGFRNVAPAATDRVSVYITKCDDAFIEDPITRHLVVDSASPAASANAPPDVIAIKRCWDSTKMVSDGLHTAFPIENDGACLGVIYMAASKEALEPSMPMLNAIRNIAGLSVGNLLLLEDVKFQADKAEGMLLMATRLSRDNLDEKTLSRSIIDTAKQLTNADRCSVFMVKGEVLRAYFEDGAVVTMGIESGIAGHVAKTGETVNIGDAYADARFNVSVDKATGYHTKTILSMPVYYEGNIVAVAQLINKKPYYNGSMTVEQRFGTRDSDLFSTFSTFVGASLRNCRINQGLLQEKQKSQAILDVVTLLSNTDIRDVKGIVSHVMIGARKLLNADRASLFLVDKERNELYSEVADSTGGQQIRFPSGKGIAGTVAATGVSQNIRDAYTDDRFNRDFDVKLGYRTHSILCEPISFRGEVLAVAQLMNKIDDNGIATFNAADESTFKTFALFAGISISNSHLLQFAVKAGQEAMALGMRLDAGMDVAPSPKSRAAKGYTDAERAAVYNHPIRKTAMDIGSPNFDLLAIREAASDPLDAAAAVVLKILIDSGYSAKMNCPDHVVTNFVLHCRSKYRKVPYHNWFHAVDACQTIYSYLTAGGAAELLTDLECFTLLATALVHDLDHMGVNNSFHLKTDSPLGILSSVSGNNSVLEVHHCNLAIEILEEADANIFSGLSNEDRRAAFKSMIESVLSTDMARHGEILTKFSDLCANEGFSRDNFEHRRLLMQVLMKAADISNVTKPFSVSRQWAMAVTEEFHQQGDKEKEKGVEVLPMFDRSKNNELAKGQLGFIGFVAERFFTTIVGSLMKRMQWTVDNITANKAEWDSILNVNKK